MEVHSITIPFRLPSLNQYINECRKNKYAGANMKKNVEKDIGWYINLLPEYKNPIKIHFIWVEENKRRDLDNVCFAKKFIDWLRKHLYPIWITSHILIINMQ